MKTNLSFLIMLFVAVVAFVSDIIIYILKLDYLVSLIISFIVVMGLLVFLLKKRKIEVENYFCKWDLIFLVILLIFTIIKIVIPDYQWDSLNYHYYNQKYPFEDKINFDFFVSDACVGVIDFIYPLGDRMNYIFRFLFGLRIGTILKYFSIMVIYYEIKKILKFLKPDCNKILLFFTPILALFVPAFYRYIGTYQIDMFSVVFLLEIFYIGIKEKDLFNKKIELYYWFLICGITVGIKISNLILIIPVGINIIYNNIKLFKELKIKDYIVSLTLFFLPFLVYGLNNFCQMRKFLLSFFRRR